MTRRAWLVCCSITLAALSSAPASAELPAHRTVAQLGPTRIEGAFGEDPFPNHNPDFGAAVAIRNGIAFVGIPAALPTAHVAVYGLTTAGWARNATLSVSDAVPAGGYQSNGFGSAIAFRDGLAVIASYSFLHVFKRVNGVWTDIQKLVPPPNPSPTPDLWKISAMRYENGILAIGWNHFSGDHVVHVYELAANGKFVKRATLRATDGAANFGADVATAGNVLVVGADGAAYVFRRRSDGTWVKTQKLVAADSSPVRSFGAAVGIDQGLIIVGAPEHDCVGGDNGVFCESTSGAGAGGAAYGFVPFSGQFTQVFKLRPGSAEHANYWQFGRRISMMGKFVVIDAAEQEFVGDPELFGTPPGLAFTYTRDGSTLTAHGLARGYIASDSLALANNWLLVGSTLTGQFCPTILAACPGEARIFDLNH
ncbi:MAG TPA: FG-GAP repeat protein [Steroidobacteraceae bacterium]|nr:FG-GAP repeat protein [Steroidobacteraceae bacterium]